MNESDARRALLVRAFEAPPVAPWSEADAAWASREAAREQGEAATPEALLAARARLAFARLAEREPSLRAVLAATAWPAGASTALIGLAFVLGLASDAVGSSMRINLLAPPLLGLLAWNLCVYAALLLAALRGGRQASAGASAAAAAGPLRRAIERLLQWSMRRHATARAPAQHALARFVADWLAAARHLNAARIVAALHAAAGSFALGLLASLYLRGIAFEYRAGWDSTFLSPHAVQRLLAIVLGAAAQLSGIALPDIAHLTRLRFAAGTGENAAPWIHLFALSVALFVLLPRAVLCAFAAWRARRLAAHLPLPLADAYFARLLRMQRGQPVQVEVRPYSYRLPPEQAAGLGRLIERELGPNVQLHIAPSTPLGAEAEAGCGLTAAPSGALSVVLFALSATPERESHGAFLRALHAGRPAGTRRLVLIDESGWRERFGAAGESRREQRRDLWRRWLREQGEAEAPWFADLACAEPPPLHAARAPGT